jgi:hypothetical protein
MKAKVIETGEIVNVLPYPTIYQEKGQGPDRREWYEDDLEFELGPKRVSLDKVCNFLIDNLNCSLDFDEYGNVTIDESNWCSEKYNTIPEFIEGLRKEFE